MSHHAIERRRMLASAASAGAAFLAWGCAGRHPPRPEPRPSEGGGEVISPAEDLMREHGLLNRILLIYEECAQRLESASGPSPSTPIGKSAQIVQRFVEGYHAQLEEEHLFPRFERAGQLLELVTVLRRQHEAGRVLTEQILGATASGTTPSAETLRALPNMMRAFVRMYRPHEAREDTVLFPALRNLVGKRELAELGELFEHREQALFGRLGFAGMVEQVADIERDLGIFDLALFTPNPLTPEAHTGDALTPAEPVAPR